MADVPKGPWKTEKRKDGDVELQDSDGDHFATVYGDDDDPLCCPSSATAALIVQAVNERDSLIAELKEARAEIASYREGEEEAAYEAKEDARLAREDLLNAHRAYERDVGALRAERDDLLRRIEAAEEALGMLKAYGAGMLDDYDKLTRIRGQHIVDTVADYQAKRAALSAPLPSKEETK